MRGRAGRTALRSRIEKLVGETSRISHPASGIAVYLGGLRANPVARKAGGHVRIHKRVLSDLRGMKTTTLPNRPLHSDIRDNSGSHVTNDRCIPDETCRST